MCAVSDKGGRSLPDKAQRFPALQPHIPCDFSLVLFFSAVSPAVHYSVPKPPQSCQEALSETSSHSVITLLRVHHSVRQSLALKTLKNKS